ncbi:MAG: HAMP domain-containing sensor histidine kinase [Candidatus Omnitrophica bacterium]|nr:HAMP domain-containing sensor histidine kinase [Candidatus Omnitrophota bacterium]
MDQAKREIHMTARMAVFICAATIIFFCICIAVNYFYISEFLRNAAGEDQGRMARFIASSVADKIDRKIELAEARFMGEVAGAMQAGSSYASIGDIQLDEKTGAWSLPVNIALMNNAGKALSGRNISIDIADISAPIKDFKIGSTGHAALVDDRAYLVYAPGVKPFGNKFCSYNELQKALGTDKGWVLMDGVYGHQGMAFASFYRIEGVFLSKNNVKWWLFIVQDADRISMPLNAAMPKILIIGVILAILALFAGIILGKIATGPIAKLRADADRLSAQNERAQARTKKFGDDLALALTRISGMISNIRHGLKAIVDMLPVPANEKQRDALNAENSNIDMMAKDLDELSDMVRIEAGKLELNMQTADIKDIIKSSLFVFEPKIRGKGLDLKIDILKGRVDVYADVNRIKQVLSSLLGNCVKATDKGSIEILLKEMPDDVEFSIRDTGLGVLPDKISGLGLYISKAIIEKHNGKFLSENVPGKGSRYSFRLPKHKPETTG